MRGRIRRRWLIAAGLMLSACGSSTGGPVPVDAGAALDGGGAADGGNRKPIAVAKVPTEPVDVFTEVTLDGRDSFDPDGEPLTGYFWVLINRPAESTAALRDVDRALAHITPDRAGVYRIGFVVFTGTGASDRAEVEVIASDACCKPVARGGGDKLVALSSSVALDGTGSTDPRNQALRFSWRIASGPAGHAATLGGADQPSAVFTPDRAKPHAHYEVELVVSNNQLSSDPDVVAIDVANGKPEVSLGANRKVAPGTVLTLTATATDSDGDPLSYGWTLLGDPPPGSELAFDNPPTATAVLRTSSTVLYDYEVEAVVNDGFENSLPARVVISTGNAPPTVDIAEQDFSVGHTCNSGGACEATATLDWTAQDPEGDAVDLGWSLDPPVPGVTAIFSDPMPGRTTATLTATSGAIAGTYRARLCGTDPLHAQQPQCDSVQVTVTNQPPVALPAAPAQLVYHATTVDGSGTRVYSAAFTLPGSGRDPEFGTTEAPYLRYFWSGPSLAQMADPNVGIGFDDARKKDPQVTMTRSCPGACPGTPLLGFYTFHLQVTDPSGAAGADRVQVQIRNRQPTLSPIGASPTSPVRAGAVVTLSTSGQDLDGDPLSYRWQLVSQPPGSDQARLTPGDPPTTATLATDARVTMGSYVVEAVANDGFEDSQPAPITIAINAPPAVGAGPDQPGVTHSCNTAGVCSATATLAGTVTDPENSQLTLSWSVVPADGRVTFSNPSLASTGVTLSSSSGPIAGTYTFRFCASDGSNDAVCDDMLLTVTNDPPFLLQPPSAPALVYHTAISQGGGVYRYQATVTLTANARDPESPDANYNLTFGWTNTAKADAGAVVAISSQTISPPNAVETQFTIYKDAAWSCPPTNPGLIGDYTFVLTVTDRNGATVMSQPVTVKIENRGPKNVKAGDALTVNHAYVGGPNPYEAVVAFPNRTAGVDEDSDPLCYDWTLGSPQVPAVCIFDGASCTLGPVYVSDPTGASVTLRGDSRLVKYNNATPTRHWLCLTARDPWGETNSDCQSADVSNRAPTISLTASSPTCIHAHTEDSEFPCESPCPGYTTLSTTVNDPDGDPVLVTWTHSNPIGCTLEDPPVCSASCGYAAEVTCSSKLSSSRTGSWTATVTEVDFGGSASQAAQTTLNGCSCVGTCPSRP